MTETCEEVVALNRSRRGGRRAEPKPPAEPEPPRIPRITRLMALAIKFQDMVDHGEVSDYADLARLGFVTRARLTQIMNLLLLAPDIQASLLMQDAAGEGIPERLIRPLVAVPMWDHQRLLWHEVAGQARR